MRAEYLERLPTGFIKYGSLHNSCHSALMNNFGLRMNDLALPWTDVCRRHP